MSGSLRLPLRMEGALRFSGKGQRGLAVVEGALRGSSLLQDDPCRRLELNGESFSLLSSQTGGTPLT